MYEVLGSLEDSSFYADVIEAGGLAKAIQAHLDVAGSSLRVNDGVALFPFANVSVERDRRLSQISTAKNKRLFLFDFWDQGIYLAHAATPSLPKVAEAIDAWIARRVSTGDLQQAFPFVAVEPRAKPHEEGAAAEVEWRWATLHEHVRGQLPKLTPLVEKTMNVPALRQLFPFTSLYWLCFSRCTGYPFSGDCPTAVPVGEGRFRVTGSGGKLLGEGMAAEAVEWIAQHLPPNCGPAVQGTADDLP